ncbi:MAG: phosphatidylglycerophosphatase A [Candidatus Omnitrophota bacterium]
MKPLIKIIASFFYVGYLPLMPGTFGSLAGVGVYFLIKNNIWVYVLSTIFLVILGFLFSGRLERIMGKKDARVIVIDEVVGMLLSLLFIPYDIRLVVAGFIIFRILDTLKPFAIRRLQHLKGSAGVMLDDIAAALCTNIILQLFLSLTSFKTS